MGVKNKLTAFFTQKTGFKSGNQYLRPGALLTVSVGGEYYSVLFLHTKSSPMPIGLGLRDDMFDRAFKLKRLLDKNTGGSDKKANFLFLGDLNTMGMKLMGKKDFIPAGTELKNIDRDARYSKMRRLDKDAAATWWNGPGSKYPPSDLDHVIASKHLTFKKFGEAEVRVIGWPEEPNDQKKGEWIDRYSDHGMLYLEVQKV